MFSVIGFRYKTINTAPDLWITKEEDEYFVIWPVHKENRPVELNNAIKNQEKPKSNWVKMKCTILQTKFGIHFDGFGADSDNIIFIFKIISTGPL